MLFCMQPAYHQWQRKKERDQEDYVGETANSRKKLQTKIENIILNFWAMLPRVKTQTFPTLLRTTGCYHTYAYGKLIICTNMAQHSCPVYNSSVLTIWLLGACSFHSVFPITNITEQQSRPFILLLWFPLKTTGFTSQSRYLVLCIVLVFHFSLEEKSAFEGLH